MKSAILRSIVFIVFLILFIPLICGAKGTIHAKLKIDFNSGGQPYDRMIFGQFIGHFHQHRI